MPVTLNLVKYRVCFTIQPSSRMHSVHPHWQGAILLVDYLIVLHSSEGYTMIYLKREGLDKIYVIGRFQQI